ncbi:hypothetical protein ABK040_012135 [Willaertia magna]
MATLSKQQQFTQSLDDLSLTNIIEYIPVHYFPSFSLTCKRMNEILQNSKRLKEIKNILLSIQPTQFKNLSIELSNYLLNTNDKDYNNFYTYDYIKQFDNKDNKSTNDNYLVNTNYNNFYNNYNNYYNNYYNNDIKNDKNYNKYAYDILIYIMRKGKGYYFSNLNSNLRSNIDLIYTIFKQPGTSYLFYLIENKDLLKDFNFIKTHYEAGNNRNIVKFIPQECFNLQNETLQNLEFIKLCGKYEGSRVFSKCDKSMLQKEFVLSCCKVHCNQNDLQYINFTELTEDFDFMINLSTITSDVFTIAPKSLQNSRIFVQNCMKTDPSIFTKTFESFQIENKDLILNEMKENEQNFYLFNLICNTLRNDLNFIKDAILVNYKVINYLNNEEMENLEIQSSILESLQKLKEFDRNVLIVFFRDCNDINFLQKIITMNPIFVNYLSGDNKWQLFDIKSLQNKVLNYKLMKQLFTKINENKMLELINLILQNKIKKNKSLLFTYLKELNSGNNEKLNIIVKDKEIIKKLILEIPITLKLFYNYFLQNLNILEEIIIINPYLLKQMKKLKYFNKICSDKEFITKIVTLNIECFKYLPKGFRNMKKNKIQILEIIEKNPKFTKYVKKRQMTDN